MLGWIAIAATFSSLAPPATGTGKKLLPLHFQVVPLFPSLLFSISRDANCNLWLATFTILHQPVALLLLQASGEGVQCLPPLHRLWVSSNVTLESHLLHYSFHCPPHCKAAIIGCRPLPIAIPCFRQLPQRFFRIHGIQDQHIEQFLCKHCIRLHVDAPVDILHIKNSTCFI